MGVGKGSERFGQPPFLGANCRHFQCSKSRFYFVHLPGAKTPKMVHPAIWMCVACYINLFKNWEKPAHTGCTSFKIYAPKCAHRVQGAPLISNTDFLYKVLGKRSMPK